MNEALLNEIRLVDVLECPGILTERYCQRRKADGTARKALGDCAHVLAVGTVEPIFVNTEQVERCQRAFAVYRCPLADLSYIPHAPKDAICDAGRAPRTSSNLVRGLIVDRHFENSRRPANDQQQFVGRVVLESK